MYGGVLHPTHDGVGKSGLSVHHHQGCRRASSASDGCFCPKIGAAFAVLHLRIRSGAVVLGHAAFACGAGAAVQFQEQRSTAYRAISATWQFQSTMRLSMQCGNGIVLVSSSSFRTTDFTAFQVVSTLLTCPFVPSLLQSVPPKHADVMSALHAQDVFGPARCLMPSKKRTYLAMALKGRGFKLLEI